DDEVADLPFHAQSPRGLKGLDHLVKADTKALGGVPAALAPPVLALPHGCDCMLENTRMTGSRDPKAILDDWAHVHVSNRPRTTVGGSQARFAERGYWSSGSVSTFTRYGTPASKARRSAGSRSRAAATVSPAPPRARTTSS